MEAQKETKNLRKTSLIQTTIPEVSAPAATKSKDLPISHIRTPTGKMKERSKPWQTNKKQVLYTTEAKKNIYKSCSFKSFNRTQLVTHCKYRFPYNNNPFFLIWSQGFSCLKSRKHHVSKTHWKIQLAQASISS